MVALGHPADEPRERTRRPLEEIAFHGNRGQTRGLSLDGLVLTGEHLMRDDRTLELDPGEVLGDTDHELLVRVADRAMIRNWGQFLLRFSMRPLLVNGGFEQGGARPRAWGLGAWSRNEKTKYEIRGIRDNPRSGNWCLMMRGIAGALNMVSSQRVPVELGKTYVLRGFYRGDVPARASFCSQSGKNQYVYSPSMGPSEDWIPFEWQFTVENPEERLLLALRLGSVGTVFFDDLRLDEKAATDE